VADGIYLFWALSPVRSDFFRTPKGPLRRSRQKRRCSGAGRDFVDYGPFACGPSPIGRPGKTYFGWVRAHFGTRADHGSLSVQTFGAAHGLDHYGPNPWSNLAMNGIVHGASRPAVRPALQLKPRSAEARSSSLFSLSVQPLAAAYNRAVFNRRSPLMTFYATDCLWGPISPPVGTWRSGLRWKTARRAAPQKRRPAPQPAPYDSLTRHGPAQVAI